MAFGKYSRASSARNDTYFTASCYFGFTKTGTGRTQGSGRSVLSSQQSQLEEDIWLLEEAEEGGIDAKHFARGQTLA